MIPEEIENDTTTDTESSTYITPENAVEGDEGPLPECQICLRPFEDYYYLGEKHGFALIGCNGCGTVVTDPMPTPEILDKYYNEYKGTTNYTTKRDKKIGRAKKRIEKLMAITKGKRFLDVGCNHGFAVSAAQKLDLDAKGIDVDASAIKYAQENFGEVNFKAISIEDYAKEGHQADIIYCSEVIEHLISPESFVKAMKKILAPDGIIYLTTPDGNHFMLPGNFTKWRAVIPPEHIFYFSKKGMKILFERCGIKIDKFFFNFKPGIQLIASHAKKKNKTTK